MIVKELHLSIYLSIKEKTQVRFYRSSQSSGGDRRVKQAETETAVCALDRSWATWKRGADFHWGGWAMVGSLVPHCGQTLEGLPAPVWLAYGDGGGTEGLGSSLPFVPT